MGSLEAQTLISQSTTDDVTQCLFQKALQKESKDVGELAIIHSNASLKVWAFHSSGRDMAGSSSAEPHTTTTTIIIKQDTPGKINEAGGVLLIKKIYCLEKSPEHMCILLEASLESVSMTSRSFYFVESAC